MANESAPACSFVMSPAPRLSDPVRRLLLDLDALEAVRVEPVLQPVDVLLGTGLAARVLDRHVVVDGSRPSASGRRRRSRCQHDEHRRRRRRGGRRSRRRAPRGAAALQVAHERVEQERDHRGRQEEEERVAERAREEPDRGRAGPAARRAGSTAGSGWPGPDGPLMRGIVARRSAPARGATRARRVERSLRASATVSRDGDAAIPASGASACTPADARSTARGASPCSRSSARSRSSR